MSNISDIIEEFILSQLEDDMTINLSRNELADFFGCAPSQINYVLSTRFTPLKGFDVESRRGGGGYIKLIRIDNNSDEYVQMLLQNVLTKPINFANAVQVLDNLLERLIISEEEYNIIRTTISPKSLAMPVQLEDKVRANILKNVLVSVLRK